MPARQSVGRLEYVEGKGTCLTFDDPMADVQPAPHTHPNGPICSPDWCGSERRSYQ